MSYEEHLMHFGIQGMHWGARNGPPYPLSYRQMNPTQRRLRKQSYEAAGSKNLNPDGASKKPANKMSNEELNDSLNRLRKEKEYRELTSNDINQGSAFVKSLLAVFGATAAVTIATGAARKIGNYSVDKGPGLFKSLWSKISGKETVSEITAKDIASEFKDNPNGLKEAVKFAENAERLAKLRNKG